MTDARFPDRWLTDRRFILLSGDAFKLYGIALMWCVDNRTDGFLDDRDLPCLPGVLLGCMGELEQAKLLSRRKDGWTFPDFKKSQTSRRDLETADAKREEDRVRKAAERAAKKEAERAEAASDPSSSARPPDVPPDSPQGHPPGRPSGRSRRGEATLGNASLRTSRDEEEPSRVHAREELQACAHCGQPSTFELVGGYCRRANCTNDRSKAA